MALYTVTNLNDGVNIAGSLRDAIAAANASPGADIIEFAPGLNGTIALTNGELVITDSVAITGLGATVTIDANGQSRVFTIDDGDSDGADEVIIISDLTITGGDTADDGGGIKNAENLTLRRVRVQGNSADNDGGGIDNSEGTLRLLNSVVSGNTASDDGGGIYNDTGTVILNNSGIRNNTAADDGGGINSEIGLVRINNSVVNRNTAGYDGGGIYTGAGRVDLNNSTISGNTADNDGGGVYSFYSGVTVNNSTIDNNLARDDGGGVYNLLGTVRLKNSTISGNTARDDGGGVNNEFGLSRFENSTVSDNQARNDGGGIYNGYYATATLSNSLITGNRAAYGQEVYNAFGDYGYVGTVQTSARNLFGHSAQNNLNAFYNFVPSLPDINATSDGTNTDLEDILDPLANNGGPTRTHGLPDGSPAIDAGNNSNVPNDAGDQDGDNNTSEDVPFDQRGTVARVTNGRVDIGAYEECFLTGTRILTDKGEVTVETLQIGDRVQTADGTFEPIKWIGRQTRTPQQIRNPLRSYPIHLKAGALGNGLPHRDLLVSPDHALLFEGLLINAGALVNGTSIVKTEPTGPFTYYHVELDKHALLVAEGTAAESYLPQKEDRLVYDNGAEYEELYPHDSKILLWPLDYPRISSYGSVPRYIRKQLAQIAAELGSEEKTA